MLEWRGRKWHPSEWCACMAFDVFRIAWGGKPRTFTVREVITWLESMADQ